MNHESLIASSQKLALDIYQKSYQTVTAKQYDKHSRFLMITCTDHGQAMPLSDSCTVHVKMLTPDGRAILNNAQVQEDGSLLVELTESMLACPGKADAEINIYHTDGGSLLSTMSFSILIEASVYDDEHAIASDEYRALTDLVEKASKDYEYVITSANESAEKAKRSEENTASFRDEAAQIQSSFQDEAAQIQASFQDEAAQIQASFRDEAAQIQASFHESEMRAKESERNADKYASLAAEKADHTVSFASAAKESSARAEQSANESSSFATKAESFAHGGTGTRQGEDTDNSEYYYSQIKNISDSFSGALRPMGTVPFDCLPARQEVSAGDMYNISDQFTTSDDFKEGPGNVIPAGSNIYKTSDGFWDVLAGSPVSGVKGEQEHTYRRGLVNLTSDDIGALPNATKYASSDSVGGAANWVSLQYGKELNLVSNDPENNTVWFNHRKGNSDDITQVPITDYYFKNGQKKTAGVTLHADYFSGTAASAGMVDGCYTQNGGQQPPSYVPSGGTRFNMWNAFKGITNPSGAFMDVILMDNYTGSDVPYVTGIGITKNNGNPRMFIANGAKGGTENWAHQVEVITSGNVASSHSHSWDSITSKPSTFSPSSHSHSWDSITSKPSTFSPSSHSHSWDSITSKPSTFAPSSHSHSYLPLSGGTLTGVLTANAGINTGANIVSSVAQSTEFHISCKWMDGNAHNLVARNNDGLTAAFGWIGSANYKTVSKVRGQTVSYQNASGTTSASDARLKNSFKPLNEFEEVYMDIEPCAFKYNDGTSGRYHFGTTAQSVRKSFEKHGFTMNDFGGFIQMQDSPENEDYCGVDDPMGLIYTEFTMWNMHMIQKAWKKNTDLENENKHLKERLVRLEEKIKQFIS